MDPTPLELLEVEVKFQAKQIEVLTNAVKFLENKIASLLSEMQNAASASGIRFP